MIKDEHGFPRAYHALLGAIFLLMLLALRLEPINDVDIFWQVRLGQLMIENWSLIVNDPFTFTHNGETVPTIGWLAQIIFALIFHIDAWRGVVLINAILYSTAFMLAGITAVYCSGFGSRLSLFSLSITMFFSLMSGLSNAMVRPQSFGLFCFAAVLYLVRCRPSGFWRLIILGLIALIWQNTHPSVAIGLVLVGSVATFQWIDILLHGDRKFPWFMTMATAILGLAQLATPMGWDIFQTSVANFQVARGWLEISEWMPPWHPSVWKAMIGFYFAFGFSLIMLIGLKFRITRSEWAIFLAMTVMALSAARFVVFWSIAMIPLWTRWMECLRGANRFNWPVGKTILPSGFLTIGLIGILATFSIPAAIKEPLESWDFLDPCMRALREAVPTGRIYNYREWGGPLILEGHPNWKVAIDGRLYMYSRQDWQNYNDAALGRIPITQLVSQYQPDALFLHPSFHKRLIALLEDSNIFTALYEDEFCVVFLPKTILDAKGNAQ